MYTNKRMERSMVAQVCEQLKRSWQSGNNELNQNSSRNVISAMNLMLWNIIYLNSVKKMEVNTKTLVKVKKMKVNFSF